MWWFDLVFIVYVGDPSSTLLLFGHASKSVIIRSDVGDDWFFVRSRDVYIFSVEERGDAQILLRHIESVLQVGDVVVWFQFCVLDKIRSMCVDHRIEILTCGYPAVFRWHQRSSASLADFLSVLSAFSSSTSITISSIWKRRMMVQMRPRISRGLPSTISSAPMLSKRT